MLNGIDISHWNWNMKNRNAINDYDFIIMKATEGVKFVDNRFDDYLSILNPITLKGFYHFARPDQGNSPEAEALHFTNTIKQYLDGLTLIALDVEAEALKVKNLDSWVTIWCQVVEMETGIKPLIYCSAAECHRFNGAAELGCGLWVAKWSDKKPTAKQMSPWKFWAIWQYSDKGTVSGVRTDLNYFNGTYEQYLKYCRGN